MKAKYDAYQGIIIYETKDIEKRKCCRIKSKTYKHAYVPGIQEGLGRGGLMLTWASAFPLWSRM